MINILFLFQAFLSEKSLESSVKYIVRRFPNIDPKSLSNVQPLRNEVLKSLSLYYYTFVDLLDYRDHVTELLTTIGACGIGFDITVNFELTKLYLEVVRYLIFCYCFPMNTSSVGRRMKSKSIKL
jgi:NCK-associated protein 1